MKPLTSEDLVPIDAYGPIRERYRRAVIDYKKRRRLPVGDQVTLLFEDRETLRFQVQEMLWVERIREPEKIQGEIDVYNELVPGPGELSATLFVEVPELGKIRPTLDRLIGIDEQVALVLGDGQEERAIPARFDPKQFEADRISAVQYVRISLSDDDARMLADDRVRARVRIDHPAYAREVEISAPVRQSLAAGLASDPERLLPPARIPEPSPQVIFTAGCARAIRPAAPRFPGHVVVEPTEPVASALDASPALLADVFAAVQRAAADVVAQHGACRIQADIPGDGLRFHVFAPAD